MKSIIIREFHDVFSELYTQLKTSKRNRKLSVAFGSMFTLTLFLSYTVLSTVFPLGMSNSSGGNWVLNKQQIRTEAMLDQHRNSLRDELTSEPTKLVDLQLLAGYMPSQTADGAEIPKTPIEAVKPIKLRNPVGACVIKVDGEIAVALATRVEAEGILSKIQAPYLEKSGPAAAISFAENVELIDMQVEKETIVSPEIATAFILSGENELKSHEVQSGESIWSIARKYDMKVVDIAAANPGIDVELIHIGDQPKLSLVKPVINIKTQETLTMTEKLPFKQVVETSKKMFKNQSKVKTKGIAGKRIITADVVRINGKIISRTILSEKVLKTAKTEYVVKGTKALPAKTMAMAFSRPSRGAMTSRFGSRWGRLHAGIDIDGNTGDIIRAAGAGTVIFAGWGDSLGWLTKISHGKGIETWYGHQSKQLVNVGDKVEQGQVIGKIGSTGRSTGSHLHFQVTKNGKPVNPLSYIRK